jgi:hypothetical protein
MRAMAEAGGSFVVSPDPWLMAWCIAVTVGALVTVAKGRWDWLVMGLLLAGTIWPLTALLLAKPDSIWGRAFYGGAKMARARRSFPGHLPYAP